MTSDDIYFAGPKAVLANGGNPVRMYAPATFSSGSSLQHISNSSSNLLYAGEMRHVMRPFLGNGNFQRTWTTIERAMLEDIGWQLNTGPDVTPPFVINRNPGIGESGVSTGTDIVVYFNEPIAIGTGNISIVNITDGGQTDIAVTDSSQVSVSGGTLTVNPATNLLDNKEYAVLITADAIDDLAGNSFAGILLNTEWRFTVSLPDGVAPTLASTNPANGATVSVGSNLVATFSEPIAIGTGNITLRNLTEGTDILIASTRDPKSPDNPCEEAEPALSVMDVAVMWNSGAICANTKVRGGTNTGVAFEDPIFSEATRSLPFTGNLMAKLSRGNGTAGPIDFPHRRRSKGNFLFHIDLPFCRQNRPMRPMLDNQKIIHGRR